jgi:UDP-N-acetylglucosamine 2-epimerase
MIHIFIGTKAQYIKTAPLIRLLDRRGIGYRLIDSGQHASLTVSLRRELGVREPDVCLRRGDDIASLPRAALWMMKVVLSATLRPGRMVDRVFGGKTDGVCVIHGDTPTTLLSVFLARRARIPLAHIEAGLRSFNYLNPFPEELIRVLAMKRARLLFAPSVAAMTNLEGMGLKGEKHGIGVNTNLEALKYSWPRKQEPPTGLAEYALFVIHRVETLHNRKRMEVIIDLVHRLARDRQLVFVLHPPTELILKKRGEYQRLEQHSGITLRPLLPHAEFINLLDHADFVVTDGGSIQEESFYLGTPCLLMRRRTERDEGIGENVLLSEFRVERIDYFVDHWKDYRREPSVNGAAPLDLIIERIKAYGEAP